MKLYQIITGGFMLASLALTGCPKKQSESQKPLDTIVGVPELPASSVSYHSGSHVSFVLNLPDGKEVLCSYHGHGHANEVTETAAVVIDANSDIQNISVSGRRDGNRMQFLEVNHPDFGKIIFKYGHDLKHPDY